MQEKYFVIVNPNAGRGVAKQEWDKISAYLQESGISFESAFTLTRYNAIKISAEAIKNGFRNLLVVGGDGSLHEAVNGVFLQQEVASKEITLAQIPFGTGNDWGKTYQNPVTYKESVDLLKTGKIIYQDIGKIIYHTSSGLDEKYFINMAGFGFDAMVLKDVLSKKEKGKGGKLTYLMSLFLNLMKSKHYTADVKIDDIEFRDILFTLAAGIGRYNGNGMMQLPFSLPDDGFLDMTWIKDISKMGVIMNVKGLFDGTFIKHPKVHQFRGKNIHIKSDEKILIEADGEFLGHTPAHLSILPKAVKVIVNNSEVTNKKDKYVS